jgi:hypothetical protein
MLADWVFQNNLRPFLTVLGWIAEYQVDEDDWLAVSCGLRSSDVEAVRWYEYGFLGRHSVRLWLAYDSGSSVIHARVEAPAALEPQVRLAVAVFQHFRLA